MSINQYFKNQNIEMENGTKYRKNGIILFGCGFASGLGLENSQKFSYRLSEAVKRPVYNYGIAGGYIQHAILLVQSGELDNIIKNSDYVIYLCSGLRDGHRLEVYPGGFLDFLLIGINLSISCSSIKYLF